MKVLITGGAGFIGSNLCRKYLERGDEVYVVDNLSTGKFENISDLLEKYPDRISFDKDSILNDKLIMKLTSLVDVVVHLAAAVGVKYIINNPLSAMETNIIGTENVLRGAKVFKKKIIIASSSEVYGDQVKAPLVEEDSVIFGPSVKLRWSYAASKLVDEFLALSYYRTLNIPVVICRFFNIIGPNQTGEYGMVVPRFVNQALKNEPLSVYGEGDQSRTFTFIEDAIGAIMNIVDKDDCIGEIINIGGTEEIKIVDLAKKIIKISGSLSRIEFIPYKRVYGKDFDDMKRRVPSLKKAGKLLNFKPKYSLDESLKIIIDSMK
jgi:UDP-glucose 4-epimerase